MINNKYKNIIYIGYEITMAVLSIASIFMIVLDYAKSIDITAYPYNVFDNLILAIFTIDYFGRLIASKNKRKFITGNIWDLLSIIPVNQAFYFFRAARIFRIFILLKLLRLVRLVGLIGKLRRFINTNGLIYYIYVSISVLIIGASMYSISEKVDFANALWWSITTATTVGYGDISPTTSIGKLAAVMVMIIGIGFIGMLTSSISNFFISIDEVNLKEELTKLHEELAKMHNENVQLNDKLDRLEQIIKKKN
ncbi:potassium channel family protein [Limosilactobacillus fermentum]